MFSLLRATGIVSACRAFSTSYVARDIVKISLVGRLGNEPEISNTPNGMEIVRYIVGASPGKDKPTTWYKFTIFEPSDRDKAYLASMPKGTMVLAEGDANFQTYEDGEGKERVSFGVTHRSVNALLRPKPAGPTE